MIFTFISYILFSLSAALLCYISLISKPEWNILTVSTMFHATIRPAFSQCSPFSFELCLNRTQALVLVEHLFDWSNQTQNNNNSAWQILFEYHHTSWDTRCVFLCACYSQLIYIYIHINCESTQQYVLHRLQNININFIFTQNVSVTQHHRFIYYSYKCNLNNCIR